MAKQAKRPVAIPAGVKVEQDGRQVRLTGPVGSLALDLPPYLHLEVSGDALQVSCRAGEGEVPRKLLRSLDGVTGLYRSLIKNRLESVQKGTQKVLNISGVGFAADVKGDNLELKIGFSHPVVLAIPEGISVKTERGSLTVSGVDPLTVGDFAARVRAARPPEPYGGKGIRYADEYVRRKVSKTAGAAK